MPTFSATVLVDAADHDSAIAAFRTIDVANATVIVTEERALDAKLETLIPVGKHECVTCTRCACTFAKVHPACPRCVGGEESGEDVSVPDPPLTPDERERIGVPDWKPTVPDAGGER